ncbi:MAG: hypothetical protein CMH93_09450 [Oceanicaulis sp.]|nr:hypothetical protein [Oceanicaulis sp.]
MLADEDELQAPVTQQAAPARPATAEPDLLRGAWSVQVGAYNSADAAHQQLQRVTGFSLALNAAQPAARAVDVAGDRLWRARFEALTETEARRACNDLSARSQACFTVAPGR